MVENYTEIFSFITFHTKPLIGGKVLRITLHIVYEFIRGFDRPKYLVLFGPETYDVDFVDRIRYLIELKKGSTYVGSYNCAKNQN